MTGVEPAMLFVREADALKLHEIDAMCEPPPTSEPSLLANGLINSAPIVARSRRRGSGARWRGGSTACHER